MIDTETDKAIASQWLRAFAERYYNLYLPSSEQMHRAIAAYFPMAATIIEGISVQDLLETWLGIVAIVKLGDECIAWSVETDLTCAQTRRKYYNTSPFYSIAHELGINKHWILLGEPLSFSSLTINDIFEAELNLLEEENPFQCAIVRI